MSVFIFALMALASFSLTRFLVTSTLPPLASIRGWFVKRWSDPARGNPEYAELFLCNYCAGFWLAGLVLTATKTLGYITLPRWKVFALWLPLAGAQSLLSAIDARLS